MYGPSLNTLIHFLKAEVHLLGFWLEGYLILNYVAENRSQIRRKILGFYYYSP